MIIDVIRVFIKGDDPDDEELSRLRRSFIKRRWTIDMDGVLCVGEHQEKKEYLLVKIDGVEIDFIIEHDYEEFKTMFEATRFSIEYENEGEEEVLPEMPLQKKIIEIPNISKTTNPDENKE